MRLIAACLLFSLVCLAGKPQPRIGEGSADNTSAAIRATVFADAESVKQEVGDDLGGYYVVVRLAVTPRAGKLSVQLDDFQLKTDKDGERAHPFVPTQIAGQGVLVVSETPNGGGGAGSHRNRPTFGGMGGMGSSGGGVGNAATTMGAEGKMKQDEKENPLVKVLAAKMLPEKETADPVSGLLYFPMSSKQKVKDLELNYTTPTGKITVRFHQ